MSRLIYPLTDAQRMVDALRNMLGMKNLYGANPPTREDSLQYLRLERLRKTADPGCVKCGGAGYWVGGSVDFEIKCTCLKEKV